MTYLAGKHEPKYTILGLWSERSGMFAQEGQYRNTPTSDITLTHRKDNLILAQQQHANMVKLKGTQGPDVNL